MKHSHPTSIVVVGGGMIGLTTAILLARDGHRVTVLDRDPAGPPPTTEGAWSTWQRPGVSQFRQPHLMLPRWTAEMRRELPDTIAALEAAGAARVNLLHLLPDRTTHGWQPEDECFDTVTARRPVIEAVLARVAGDEPRVTVRRGARVTGLVTRAAGRVPHVVGVRTTKGAIAADLVIDAAGRRTPLPGWVGQVSATPPFERREQSGVVYYSRSYRGGHAPTGGAPVLTHHPSLSVLTIPGDSGTWCVVLVTSSRDPAMRRLRETRAWEATARCSPAAVPWVDGGTATSAVEPIAGVQDVLHGYVRDGAPVVTGLVAVGDAAAATNPSLGRGATIGAIHAVALRDTLSGLAGDGLAGGGRDPRGLALACDAATTQRVSPWVEATLRFDRHRLAEIDSEVAGVPYVADDPSWGMTTALLGGALQDPVLARASARIAGLLDPPPTVLGDPEVQRRLQPYLGGPRYPTTSPGRADLLRALDTTSTPVRV